MHVHGFAWLMFDSLKTALQGGPYRQVLDGEPRRQVETALSREMQITVWRPFGRGEMVLVREESRLEEGIPEAPCSLRGHACCEGKRRVWTPENPGVLGQTNGSHCTEVSIANIS